MRIGRSRAGRGGFTLLELMVATALLAMLTLLLLTVLERTSRVWHRIEADLQSGREARAVFAGMEREVRSVFPPPGPGQFVLEDAVHGAFPSDRLFFLSLRPGAPAASGEPPQLCVVGYFVDWLPAESGQAGSFALFRYFKPAAETFRDHLENEAPIPSDVTPQTAGVELLAPHVRAFTIRAWRFDAAGRMGTFVPSPAAPLPDLLEIELLALDDDSAARLSSREEWEDPSRLPDAGTALQTVITISSLP